MHEFDRFVAVGNEEPFARRASRARARRAGHRRRRARHVPPADAWAPRPPSPRDEPEEEPSCGLLLILGRATAKAASACRRDRALHAARLLVGSERQRPSRRARSQRSTRAVESSGSPPGSPATSSTSASTQRRLDFESRALRGALDRTAQLGSRSSGRAGHGSGRPRRSAPRGARGARRSLRAGRVGRLRGARDPRLLPPARPRMRAVRRRRPTMRRAPRADRRRARAARRGGGARARRRAPPLSPRPGARAPRRSPSAGSRPARSSDDLPLPDGPTIASNGASCEAGDKLFDEPLAAEEELRVGGLERRQALVRADLAERARRARAGRRRRGVSAGSCDEDRSLELPAARRPGSRPSSSFRRFLVCR